MPSISEAIEIAIRHHKAGLLSEAEKIYREITKVAPDHSDAWHLLGAVAHQQGQFETAILHTHHALELRPSTAEYLNTLGESYRALNRLDEAKAVFCQVLQINPNIAEAHNNLGNVYRDQGNLEEAEREYKRAIQINPDYFNAHMNLGGVFQMWERFDQAIQSFARSLEIDADRPEVYNQLGKTYKAAGDIANAIRYFQQLIERNTNSAPGFSNLGNVLFQAGEINRAIECLQKATELDPQLADAFNNLAVAMHSLEKYEESAECCKRTLAISPNHPEAMNNLGNCLKEQGRIDEAIDCYRKSLKFRPDYDAALINLARALLQWGDTEEAILLFQRVAELNPTLRNRIELAMVLPPIYQSSDEILAWRTRVNNKISDLLEENTVVDPVQIPIPNSFYLAYHGQSNRALQEKIAKLCAGATVDLSKPKGNISSRRDKIRIGFVSHCFKNHTVGHLWRGIIAKLSRALFEVIVLPVSDSNDVVAQFIKRHADKYLPLNPNVELARKQIAEQSLDVLYYPDIGMSPVTYTLANSRMAPVQCVSWGHPDTTGLQTFDYFLSNELLDLESAQQHYTEQLIRLKTLGLYVYWPQKVVSQKRKEDFGFPEDKHLYACLQSLFKLHPDYDETLADILRRDPMGIVVLPSGCVPYWDELVRKRFQKTIPDVVDRIQFLPRQKYDDYLRITQISDALLVPPTFGGGRTSYEAFALGAPVVTMPSTFLSGRITYALYGTMGVTDCTAQSNGEYVDIAVKLANDSDFHQSVHEKILANNHKLFEDMDAIHELEQFLQDAVKNNVSPNHEMVSRER